MSALTLKTADVNSGIIVIHNSSPQNDINGELAYITVIRTRDEPNSIRNELINLGWIPPSATNVTQPQFTYELVDQDGIMLDNGLIHPYPDKTQSTYSLVNRHGKITATGTAKMSVINLLLQYGFLHDEIEDILQMLLADSVHFVDLLLSNQNVYMYPIVIVKDMEYKTLLMALKWIANSGLPHIAECGLTADVNAMDKDTP